MTRPLLLDLFCGQGGAAVGYHRAGFDVVGVDIKPQPRYPFEFIQADALEFGWEVESGHYPRKFDAIHASPPCQRYASITRASGRDPSRHPDLLQPTIDLLVATGLPWVVENVADAPVPNPLTLCGTMFGLGTKDRELRRHRKFASSHLLMSPGSCRHERKVVGVYGGSHRVRTRPPGERQYGYQGSVAEKREAMGMPWATNDGCSQAIPPAYTEWIGNQLMQHLSLSTQRASTSHGTTDEK